MLDAPLILQAGLPASTSLTADGRGNLLLGGPSGVTEVSGDAKVRTLSAEPVLRIDGDARLLADGIHTGTRVIAPGAVDLLARDGGILALHADRLEWWPPDGPVETLATGLVGAHTLGEQHERHVYILTDTTLVDTVDPNVPVITTLLHARAVAADAQGRPYVVQGDPPELDRVDGPTLTLVARYVGDVVDMTFGTGGLLPEDTLYLLRAGGELDYLRPP